MSRASKSLASFALAATVSTLLAAALASCGGDGGGTGMGMGGGGFGGCGGYMQPPCAGGGGGGFGGAGGGQYIANALVTDTGSGALHADANLVNGWGLAFNPAGYGWVADAGTAKSTLYDGNGVPQSLVVSIPGSPSGIVYNGTGGFAFSSGGLTGVPAFIFATLQGQIVSWSQSVNSTQAFTLSDNSINGAGYTGLAIGTDNLGANLLYAADFSQGTVDVFDSTYTAVAAIGAFVDPTLPAGYSPFGIQQIGGRIYVAYAMVDDTSGDEQKGAGLGLVNVFDAQGAFVSHLIPPGGVLNAPWGMAMAPSNFGPLSSKLLVGNFGDGTIHAFDPVTGALAGTVSNNDGSAIVIDGLWGIAFGNGLFSQPTNTLFYAAGPNDELEGLYGRIDLN